MILICAGLLGAGPLPPARISVAAGPANSPLCPLMAEILTPQPFSKVLPETKERCICIFPLALSTS